MSTTKRVQVFINEDVWFAFRKYMGEKYGPNSRNTSAAVQSFIVSGLREEGHWPIKDKWKQTG